jgi:hypothetical protein
VTPRSLDPDSVQRKLVGIQDLFRRLEPRDGATGDELAADDLLRDPTGFEIHTVVTPRASPPS